MLPDEIPLTFPKRPGDMNGTLAFDVAYHLCHGVLRRNRDQHMNVVRDQMPLQNRALLLGG